MQYPELNGLGCVLRIAQSLLYQKTFRHSIIVRQINIYKAI